MRVLVVDPAQPGTDTLSTHALMRSALVQLANWGLLDAIWATGAPAIRTTTFHYGRETIPIAIKPRSGVDALVAPRRTALDPVLQDGAREAGAELVFGHSVQGLLRDDSGRVSGAVVADRERNVVEIQADLVIGADGIRSKVAELAGAEKLVAGAHSACSIFGYVDGRSPDGYHWYYGDGSASGIIPTNGGACIFAGTSSAWFDANRDHGMEAAYLDLLAKASPDLAAEVEESGAPARLRAFAGMPGYPRESVGDGWALVGDAGFFRDPITAHGITDALREAELLSRAIAGTGESTLATYQAERDARVKGMLEISDRVAAFDWTLSEVKAQHRDLNGEMNSLLETIEPAEAQNATWGRLVATYD